MRDSGRVARTASLCGGCGSLLETKLPASTSYVLAPAPASRRASRGPRRICRSAGPTSRRVWIPSASRCSRDGSSTTTAERSGADARPKSCRRCSWTHSRTSSCFAASRRSSRASRASMCSTSVCAISRPEYASDNGAPTAHVTIFGRLISVVDRQLVDTFAATAQSSAADNRLGRRCCVRNGRRKRSCWSWRRRPATAIAGDADKLKAAGGEESG